MCCLNHLPASGCRWKGGGKGGRWKSQVVHVGGKVSCRS